jgi:hypothetical protein
MEVDLAIKFVDLRGIHACVIADQGMVTPLTELISGAALKRLRDRITAAHKGVVLIAQNGQIAYHDLIATLAAWRGRCPWAMKSQRPFFLRSVTGWNSCRNCHCGRVPRRNGRLECPVGNFAVGHAADRDFALKVAAPQWHRSAVRALEFHGLFFERHTL